MTTTNAAVALFPTHDAAETAIRNLSAAGFPISNLSVVGKGYHTEEKVIGFYNAGDRISFWGSRGAFWGGIWGLFAGGFFITVPLVGPVIALGYMATTLIATIEGAALVGGTSALAAALFSIGIPNDSIVEYEGSLKADDFLVMAHGTAEDVARARSILGAESPSRLDTHSGMRDNSSFATDTVTLAAE